MANTKHIFCKLLAFENAFAKLDGFWVKNRRRTLRPANKFQVGFNDAGINVLFGEDCTLMYDRPWAYCAYHNGGQYAAGMYLKFV